MLSLSMSPFQASLLALKNVEVLLVLLQGNSAPGVKTVVGVRAGERWQQAEAASRTPGFGVREFCKTLHWRPGHERGSHAQVSTPQPLTCIIMASLPEGVFSDDRESGRHWACHKNRVQRNELRF